MIETFQTTAALAETAAGAVREALAEALSARGAASLVATGGRSPGPVYDLLAQADLDWARVSVTLSDERCVPPDDPRSNARLLDERLFTGPAARAHFIPLWPRPQDAALAAIMPFDVVMLGMGEDGHVASLIPGAPTLAEGMDLVSGRATFSVAEGVGNPPVARISLTLPALLQARLILVLIAGDKKREVVQADGYPISALLQAARAPVRILWSPSH